LIISIGSKDTFLDAWVKAISFKDHVHVIHIDCNTDWQRHSIYSRHFPDLYQTSKGCAKRGSSTTDQLDGIFMTDVFHVTEVATIRKYKSL
jgi:hypothetical protein